MGVIPEAEDQSRTTSRPQPYNTETHAHLRTLIYKWTYLSVYWFLFVLLSSAIVPKPLSKTWGKVCKPLLWRHPEVEGSCAPNAGSGARRAAGSVGLSKSDGNFIRCAKSLNSRCCWALRAGVGTGLPRCAPAARRLPWHPHDRLWKFVFLSRQTCSVYRWL